MLILLEKYGKHLYSTLLDQHAGSTLKELNPDVSKIMRTKNTENRKKREALILDAARTCFLAKGFHKTTMRDIAQEASVSLGSIYQYYKSKNDIIIAFVGMSNQETSEAIEYIMNARHFKKALKTVLYSILNEFVTKKELIVYFEILSEALKNEEIKTIVNQERTEHYFAAMLMQAKKDKKVQLNLPAMPASQVLLSAVETAAANLILHDKEYKEKQARLYIDQVVDLLLD